MNLSTVSLPKSVGGRITVGSARLVGTTFTGLGERYFDKLKKCRDKILQVDAVNGITETAGSILNKAILIATTLRNRHVCEKDRIIICSKINLELIPTILGIWFIGAIVCPIDTNMDTEECVTFLHKLQPKIAFVDMRAQGFVELTLKGCKITNCEIIIYGKSTTHPQDTDKIFGEKVDDNFLPLKLVKAKLKSAFITPSEGTTRESKLVDISHYAVLSRCISFENRIGKKIDRVLCFYPLVTFPYLVTTCSALEEGIVNIISGPFSAKYACRLIHDLKVDLAVLGTHTALQLAHYIKSTKDFNLKGLKGIVAGLMVTTAKDIAKIKSVFPEVIVMNVYGCMECGYISGGATPLRLESLPETLRLQFDRLGSAGRPCGNIKYEVIDLISNELVGIDTWGEMRVGGPCVMLGYYGDPKATAKAFERGFFKTGDIVQYDSEDFFYIRGRLDDQVFRNGISYPASDLEEIISTHPAVQEVAVVCEHEENVAYVVLIDKKHKLKEADLIAFVADFTTESKYLNAAHFVQQLPKTVFGKVKKYKLEDLRILEISKSSLTVLRRDEVDEDK